MTINECKNLLKEIKKHQDDDEKAHGMEDDFYSRVLSSIAAETAEDPVEMANIALKTKELKFSRWCA